jgi:hypothetical protein
MWIALGVVAAKEPLDTLQSSRLPPRLLNQCLRDIFTYLLNETPSVILISFIHFADMSSWDFMVNLINISSMALLVVTMEPFHLLQPAKIKSSPNTLRGKYVRATFLSFLISFFLLFNYYFLFELFCLICYAFLFLL